MGTDRLEESFSARLRELYKLEKAPETLDELTDFWKRGFAKAFQTPKGRQFLVALARGESVYGACGTKTRHTVRLQGKAGIHVACALDAMIEGVFQSVEIESSCPHCEERIAMRMVDRQIISAVPQSLVLWLGISPRGEGPTVETVCPFINFFSSQDHHRRWRDINLDQVGVLMSLSQARDFIAGALPLSSALEAEDSSSDVTTIQLEPF